MINQAFDSAGRLRVRGIELGAEVEGVVSETFTYDGLGRLTEARSGEVVSQLSYDSLSRLVSDATAGKTITYRRDLVGNPSQVVYSSGLILEQSFDDLHRLEAAGVPSLPAASPPTVSRDPASWHRRAWATAWKVAMGLTSAAGRLR